ncbi:hypothetical protein [Pseudomonas granadensis]|uniref:hypothetical protein n=1 Tax=Pseudomonas granadensis TaxID=1421430 RepID=UPI00300E87EE
MMRLNSILECEGTIVEIDEYVPLIVRFGSSRDSLPLYWRAGNGKTSLLEIGLNRYTGQIINVTVVAAGSVKMEGWKARVDGFILDVGIPAFKLERWGAGGSYSDNYIDDFSVEFELVVGVDEACILLGKRQDIDRVVENGCVSFGFSSSGELLSILISCLRPNEVALLESHFFP